MITVLFFSIVTFILTILDSKKVLSGGMKLGFIITGALAAIHYDFGNDYIPYFETYQHLYEIGFSLEDIGKSGVIANDEYGWAVLNMLFFIFGKYGFFFLVATISIFENYVYYYLIKTYVHRNWWWLAMFIYLFSTSTYLMNFSLLRQGLVASVFVAMYPWIINRKLVRCLLLTFLLSTIHTSAIFLFPFLFLGFLPTAKSGKFYALSIGVVFILLWSSGSILESLFNKLADTDQFVMYSEKYNSDNSISLNYGLGFAMNMMPLGVYIYYLLNSKDCTTTVGIIALSSICYILLPMVNFYGPILSRFSYYFYPFIIPAIPIAYSTIKNRYLRMCLLGIFLIFVGYNYIIFFSNPTWKEHFSIFHTIFEAQI